MNTMHTIKQLDYALAGLWTFYPGKTWRSHRHTRREKRPGFLNGGGFRPRRATR